MSKAENLVAELAELRKKQSQYEGWRWQASMSGFYKRFMVTKTTTVTSVLGLKRRDESEHWEEMPRAVAEEFHSFLAKKRDEAYRRIREVEQELEDMG